MNKTTLKLSVLIAIIFTIFPSYGQSLVWHSKSQSKLTINNKQTFSLDKVAFQKKSPSYNSKNNFSIKFPTGENNSTEFSIKKTQVMHPKLAQKFPDIETFEGIATDNSNQQIRFSYCSKIGLKGIITKSNQTTIEINPINSELHSFELSDKESLSNPYECNTKEKINNLFALNNVTNRNVDDGYLRSYRLALSCTGEYAQHFLDGSEANDTEKITKVLNAIVTSVNRLNGIFEKDLGITLQLVPNNDLLIYLDANSDPYYTGFGSLNDELQQTLNNHSDFGADTYDVGHLFGKETRTYGNAGCIGCVCNDSSKGSAFTINVDPSSDNMNLIAAHEFGHQFGAYHTQNSDNCRSGFNSEVEPGSGSTIMGYAGICFPNVQNEPDDYFNYTSIRDIAIHTINDSNCATLLPINNTAPSINSSQNYVIPISTPFVLEADVSDPDGNELTYCWEQNDTERPFNTTSTPTSNRVFGPLFRSLPPSLSNKRYLPELSTVVAGELSSTWEVLPSVARTINFSLTVRDNAPNGGQTVTDLIELIVEGNAGPFNITSQVDRNEIWTVGEQVTVSWDVANTNLPPINTNNVSILLSTNGGVSFDTEIISSTPNNGSASFVLPDVASTNQARLIVKAIDNVFYAINTANFTIEKSEFIVTTENAILETCNNDTTIINLSYATFLDFNETVTFSIQNLPNIIDSNFSKTIFSENTNTGEDFQLTLTELNNLSEGSYDFDIIGLSESGIEKKLNIELNVFNTIISASELLNPINNSNVDLFTKMQWASDVNSVLYTLQIATDENFNTIIENVETSETEYVSNQLVNNQNYFWRVKNSNSCSESEFSLPYAFTTICSNAQNIIISNVGVDFVELVWEGTNDSWNIEYGIQNFVPGSGTLLTSNTNSLRIENLNANTTYNFYIQGVCAIGGTSEFNTATSFSTAIDYCSEGNFYDTGGNFGNYLNNENTTTTIAPNEADERVHVIFNSFETESRYDFLNVYDGPNDEAPLLGRFDGSHNDLDFVSSHESGTLTFIFTSDGSVNRAGWDATVICEAKPNCTAPSNFVLNNVTKNEASFVWSQETDDANWTLEYGVTGFTIGTGTEVIVNNTNATIDNLIPETTYDIYLKTNCTIGGFSDVIGPVNFTTLVACAIPLGLELNAITNNSISLIWDNTNNSAQAWQVEYGIDGFTPGNGTILDSSNNAAIIENLDNNTQYQIYLRANCDLDGFSQWTAPLNAKTSINFCNGDHFYDTGGEFGNYSNNENNTTVISPENVGDRVRVKFNIFDTEAGYDYLSVYDGPDDQAPLLGRFDGISNNLSFVSSHESGTLTFVFTSDNIETRTGWDATVTCEQQPNCSAPNNFDIVNVATKSVDIYFEQSTTDASWTLEYGPNGFEIGTGTEILVDSVTPTIDNLIPETNYDIYIKTNCEIGGFSDPIGPLNFTTLIACPVARNFNITQITNSNASFTWDTTVEASSWELEYGTPGFEQGNGTIVSTSENTINITNLTGNTDYDIYIRANCDADGFSRFIPVYTFTTNCDVFVAPYLESFESFSIPECWTESTFSSNWQFNTFAANEAAAIEDRNALKNSNYAWFDGSVNSITDSFSLNTPLIDLSELSNPALSFSVFSKNTVDNTYNTLKVAITDATGITYSDIVVVNSNTYIWKDVVIDLSEYAIVSPFFVEFTVELNTTGQRFLNDILIDEIKVNELPSCTNPQSLVASTIRNRSVELSWDATGNESNWEILYGLQGFNTANSTTKFTTDTPYLLTDLLPETTYELYLRAVCEIGDSSQFIGPISFTTDCDAFETPYYQGFSTIFSIPNCWSNDVENRWTIGSYFDPITNTVIPDRSNTSNISYLYKNSFSTNEAQDYLDTPFFDISTLTNPSISFSINSKEQQDFISAKLVVDIFDGNTWNTIATIEETTNGWKDFYIDISEFSITGEVKFRFDIIHITPFSNLGDLLIDDIRIDELPTCFNPSQLEVTSFNTNSAILNWEKGNNESDWEIQYQESGFTLGNGTIIPIMSDPEASLNNLNSNTTYDVYVRSNCGNINGYSDWIGPITFKTTTDFCNGDHFYDTGGESGNYSNNENETTVIAPLNNGDRVRVIFNNFETESNYDFLNVYDGPNDQATFLGRFDGFQNNLNFTSSHPSGMLTFVFTSDGSSIRSGWDASVICEPIPNCEAPTNFTISEVLAKEAEFSWNNQTADENWTLEYGLTGFDVGTGTEIITSTTTTTIADLTPETNYNIYIKTNCDLGGFSDIIGPFNFTTTIACPVPTGFEARAITHNTTTLVWDTISNSNYEIEYGEIGFIQGNGIIAQVTENNFSIENLNSNTNYQAYLRSNCGDDGYSLWTLPITFKTLADFCAGDHFYDTGGALGDYGSRENETTVINPATIGDRVRVIFNNFETESNYDFLNVYDGPNDQATLLGSFDGIHTNLNFISTHSSGALTFVFTSDGSVTRSGWDASVICEPIPDCETPINFVVTNSTTNEASLNWDIISNTSNWEIEYGLAPLVQGNGTLLTSSKNSVTITNLNELTNYEAYVRADCGSDGYSNWTPVLSFSTKGNCDDTSTNLITNGSFECGMDNWFSLDVTSGDCFTKFESLENSNSLCLGTVNEILPSNGNRAAFAAINFDSLTGNENLIIQTVDLPVDLSEYSDIIFEYDFRANFDFSPTTDSEPRVLFSGIFDENFNSIYSENSLLFGISPSLDQIDTTIKIDDLMNDLLAFSGQRINIIISIRSGNVTGPGVVMIDNISLTTESTLSTKNNEISENSISLYPNPSNGNFSILNTSNVNLKVVEIYSTNGTLLKTIKVTNSSETNVALQNVASGNYFAKISYDNSEIVKQIIIE